MGDMAFGGRFELMRDGGDREGIWKLMEDALEFVSLELVPSFKVLTILYDEKDLSCDPACSLACKHFVSASRCDQ